jgi:maleate isomerase
MSARVGLIVPSSNTVAEVDFYRRLPAGATLHTARMYLVQTSPEAESVMLDEYLPTALTDLATTHPDVVVFSCTSAGALRGNAYEDELITRVGERTGAHVVSVMAAVRRAIVSRHAHRVAVITPYVESLNEKIRESLEAEDLDVVGIRGMGITENFEIGSVEPERIVQFALDCFGALDIDLVFASCTNFRALEARERIERALDVPVVTSNHAALEAVLEHIGASSTH